MSIVFIKYCWANRMSIKKQISQTQETELNRSSGYSFREDLCPPETMSAQVGSVSYPQHRAPVRHSIYTSFTQAGSAQEDCFVSSTNVSCEWKPSQGTKGHRGSPRHVLVHADSCIFTSTIAELTILRPVNGEMCGWRNVINLRLWTCRILKSILPEFPTRIGGKQTQESVEHDTYDTWSKLLKSHDLRSRRGWFILWRLPIPVLKSDHPR